MRKSYSFKDSEKRYRSFWDREKIYKFNPGLKSKIFSLDNPPPTVSGKMHLGHALAYSQADFIMRYKRMSGYNVFYPFGFDDNGLATELFVEKKLRIKAESMGRKDFIKLCLRETKESEKKLKEDWASLGISPDWDINYRTISPEVIRLSQISFIDLYKKKRTYRKEAPTLWCTKCRTAIAQVELEDKTVDSNFNDIIFKLENGKDLIISTTRPELLPACLCVFVHPDDSRYKNLIGKKVKVPLIDRFVPIRIDNNADPKKGSGAVMCCSIGDQTDAEWIQSHNLDPVLVIDEDGRLNEKAGKYKGLSIREARERIINDLNKEGLLVNQKNISHDVNVHERCGTEIEFLVTTQWFIKYLDLKQRFLSAGKRLNWYPKYMRVRYDNWVKGLKWDWCISRQRFYGVPFPVWYCKRCGKEIIADEKKLPVDPTVDNPGRCSCGSKEFIPEKDVMDTWATSSLTPMIVTKWKKDDKYFKKMFPMTLRSNGQDIIPFWLFNTVVKSLLHVNKLPWKDVMINGFILDPKGNKMSKSKGNIIEPLDVLDKYGADSFRFWAASKRLGLDIPYQEKEVQTGSKTVNKIWNASRFCFMHLKDFNGKSGSLEIMDRWLLTKLSKTIEESSKSFEQYDYSITKGAVENFFWNVFCDYYLEIVKDRLYNYEKNSNERRSAQYTLYHGLLCSLKLFAPIMPYITEEMYQMYFARKEKVKSIHISSWPSHYKKDVIAENIGDVAVDIISKVRRFKSKQQVSLKTPINLTVDKKDRLRLKPVLNDLQAITNAQMIDYGGFGVELIEDDNKT